MDQREQKPAKKKLIAIEKSWTESVCLNTKEREAIELTWQASKSEFKSPLDQFPPVGP